MAMQRLVPSATPVFVAEVAQRQALAIPAAFVNTKAQPATVTPFNRAPRFIYLEF